MKFVIQVGGSEIFLWSDTILINTTCGIAVKNLDPVPAEMHESILFRLSMLGRGLKPIQAVSGREAGCTHRQAASLLQG